MQNVFTEANVRYAAMLDDHKAGYHFKAGEACLVARYNPSDTEFVCIGWDDELASLVLETSKEGSKARKLKKKEVMLFLAAVKLEKVEVLLKKLWNTLK